MAKLKLPFELEKPSSNEYVTQASEVGYGNGSVSDKLDYIFGADMSVLDTSLQYNGVIVSNVFHNTGNYGLHKYALINASSIVGRTVRVEPNVNGRSATIAFLAGTLSDGETPDYCDDTVIEIHSNTFERVVPSDCIYIYVYISDKDNNIYTPIVKVLAIPSELDKKVDKIAGKGLSTNDFTNTDKELLTANTNSVATLNTAVFDSSDVRVVIPTTDHTEDSTNGYWGKNGAFNKDNIRRATNLFEVTEGEKLYITTFLRPALIPCLVCYNSNGQKTEYWKEGSGSDEYLVDAEYTVPVGVKYVGVNSANSTSPVIKRNEEVRVTKFYTKTESDNKYATKGVDKYGVRWSLTDFDDLGERCFKAVGLSATIGIGNTDGSSDFDSIYPWCEIKRCNIRINSNGARIVTFEGETGFALDGTNGDVFVRIPKFCADRYIEDGYEYVTIQKEGGKIHPAFIENGIILDEIYISAFEGYADNDILYSKGNVIPSNNIQPSNFLTYAKNKGLGYSLYDMRCVDALWSLMAVEYGNRNSAQILGHGYADLIQPDSVGYRNVTVNASNTNTVTIGKPESNTRRLWVLTQMAAGNNITICDGAQTNIVAQRKVVSINCASTSDNFVITFDGAPINITTNMFVGNAPCDCNYCETIGNSYKLNWHTGRADRPVLTTNTTASKTNPCRYRWIENPLGNLWHFLPDVSFNDRQMYVCRDLKEYVFFKTTPPYYPIGDILPLQDVLGNKNDNNTSQDPKCWLTKLFSYHLGKEGNCFGESFDQVHDGSIVSSNGYGGYYYLKNGNRIIANGGGFDHDLRTNVLTNRAWIGETDKWYLYGARLMYKNIKV